jgi:Ca-activated chloride channel family protein
MYMKRILLIFCLLLLPVHFAVAQDDDGDMIKVDTSLVLVPVTVTDDKGRFVPGLKREDFRLLDDGKVREIAHFDMVDAPFTVVVMLDLSDSTRLKLKDIQDSASAFVDQLRPVDRVAVVTFDAAVSRRTQATNDRDKIKNVIRNTRSGGSTNLYGAIDRVLKEYLADEHGRKAVIIFSDGIDTSSARDETYESTLRAAQQSDAIIFTIQYGTNGPVTKNTDPAGNSPQATVEILTTKGVPIKQAFKTGTQYLQMLAGNSGGKFHTAESVENLTDAFARIASALNEQYTLGFYADDSPAKNKPHDLKVQLTGDQRMKVRSRRGYLLRPAGK